MSEPVSQSDRSHRPGVGDYAIAAANMLFFGVFGCWVGRKLARWGTKIDAKERMAQKMLPWMTGIFGAVVAGYSALAASGPRRGELDGDYPQAPVRSFAVVPEMPAARDELPLKQVSQAEYAGEVAEPHAPELAK